MADLEKLKTLAQDNDPSAQLQLAISFFQNEEPAAGWDWLEKSVAQGFQPALFQKAMLLALGQHTDTDVKQAVNLFESMADAGNPGAMCMLSNLYSSGLVVGDDWEKAKHWFVKAFERGHIASIREGALLLMFSGEEKSLWLPALKRVAIHGDVFAQYHLGDILIGEGEEAQGHWFLAQAQKAGHAFAMEKMNDEKPIDREPEGVRRELPVNLNALVEALKALKKPVLRNVRELFKNPRSYEAKELFSKAECVYLKTSASPLLSPAIVYNSNDLRKEANPVRTNESSTFHLPQQDFVINYLSRKISVFGDEPLEHAEQLVVLKYEPGEEYLPHFDYLDPSVPGLKEEVQEFGQRIKTVLVYLNDDYEGGATKFIMSDNTYKGFTGDALLFHNVNSDGSISMESQHAGLPITKGIKWLAVKWIRNKPRKKLT